MEMIMYHIYFMEMGKKPPISSNYSHLISFNRENDGSPLGFTLRSFQTAPIQGIQNAKATRHFASEADRCLPREVQSWWFFHGIELRKYLKIWGWLVVLTIFKHISQWEGLSHILWKIKKCLKPPTRRWTTKKCDFPGWVMLGWSIEL